MTDIAPLGPAIRGTIESSMQEVNAKLMSVFHLPRCETNEKQFLNAFDLLNAIVGADMNGKTLICASIKADNVNLDLVKNGYNPL